MFINFRGRGSVGPIGEDYGPYLDSKNKIQKGKF